MDFVLKTLIKATPEQVYNAWLDSDKHSNMTGGLANCSNQIGGKFSAWNEYIEGSNIALVPNESIIQSWRTTEFKDGEGDSQVEISFSEIDKGTVLTLTHTNLPENGEQYKKGWEEHYFTPMKAYFK